MARIYNPPKCDYVVEGGRIRSLGDIRGRMTGTMMAGILGISPWSTPFQIACNLLGLCSEDIGNKPAVKMGQALEGRIISYLDENYPSEGVFVPAEQIFEKRAGDHASWVSDFEDDYFAGHVDGLVMTDNGNYILEIKTSANLDSWREGVPEYYYWQVALYNEFVAQKDVAYVGLGIVDQEIYGHPELWVAGTDSVVMFKMDIDREEVQARMRDIRDWYDKFVKEGITPDYDPNNKGDVEMYNHLVTLAAPTEDVSSMVDQYFKLDAIVKEAEKSVKDKVQLRDDLKNRIKTYMDAHRIDELVSASGACKAGVSETITISLDKEKMIADGIDITPYVIQTVTKRFTVKKCKGE